jgi:hypothetical protein
MHRPSDPRQIVVSDLSKIISGPVAPKLEHSTLLVRAKQHNHSALVAIVSNDEKVGQFEDFSLEQRFFYKTEKFYKDFVFRLISLW